MLFEQKTWKQWKKKNKHLTVWSVTWDNLQAEMLPIIRWACRQKNDGKNNATEPLDPEPMGKGFEERIIACHKRPWLNHHLNHLHTPSATFTVIEIGPLLLVVPHFFIVLSSHSHSNSILVKQGSCWDERSAGKAKKFTGNRRLHDCLRLWQLDLVAQWQREKNTLCRKTLIFSTLIHVIYTYTSYSHCRHWHSVSLILLCFDKRRWQALTNRPWFRNLWRFPLDASFSLPNVRWN